MGLWLGKLLVIVLVTGAWIEIARAKPEAEMEYVMAWQCVKVIEAREGTEFVSIDHVNWRSRNVHVEFKPGCETSRVVKLP